MEYVCLAEGFNKRKLVPATEDIWDHIPNRDRDWYTSVFIYKDQHYKKYQETGSLAGIADVTTNKIIWDFDDEENVEHARADAKTLVERLLQYGIPQDAINIAFSGSKGFSVEVLTTSRFTPNEFKNINLILATDLETNDQKIYDAQRIFRVTGTKHNKSGLYKLPLTINQLSEVPVKAIREMAMDLSNIDRPNEIIVELPQVILDMKKQEDNKLPTTVNVREAVDLDFTSKPRGFTNCKFALLNGFFEEGERSDSLMALGATCKSLGFPKDITYGMLKGAARLQAARTEDDEFPKKEIWNNIVEQIYGPNWKGAIYSCKNQPFLKSICDSLGSNKCKGDHNTESGFVSTLEMSNQFEHFSVNIEKNTIKTGIKRLDDAVSLTIGMPVALLGAPSSGKTSLAIDILNNTSKAGISSAFFSMDMYGPLVYMKQVQKHFGLTQRQIHEIFKHDKTKAHEIKEFIKNEYSRVNFSLKAGHSVQDMRLIVNDYEQKTGDKVKLIVIDYLECIAGPYSDATANTSKIAGELRDFATEMNTCIITLVQPPKSAGDASQALTSMRQIKGSSMLEQSFRVIFGIYREGFGPNMQNFDKYMTINALKNTMGPLFSLDNYWNGLKGEIRELTDEEARDLASLRKMLEAKKAAKDGGSSWIDQLVG
jgi:KaiC/GvpD/RAD55 family RecA-like ATPase